MHCGVPTAQLEIRFFPFHCSCPHYSSHCAWNIKYKLTDHNIKHSVHSFGKVGLCSFKLDRMCAECTHDKVYDFSFPIDHSPELHSTYTPRASPNTVKEILLIIIVVFKRKCYASCHTLPAGKIYLQRLHGA